MENKKGSEIFLGVIGVATLLVAIIGATFAYFSASARSGNEAIRVESTELTLGYKDKGTEGLKTNLIPASDDIATFAGSNLDWIGKKTFTLDGKPYEGKGECFDDNGNEVCSTYTFTIGNPNTTTTLDITGRVFTTLNEFKNLYFAIYDENNNQVQEPTAFPLEPKAEVPLTLNQTLLASSDGAADGQEWDAENPETFKLVTETVGEEESAVTRYNKRTYKMVIWIHETDSDQTEDDSGMMFSGGVTFDTGSDKGVTGLIAVAGREDATVQEAE